MTEKIATIELEGIFQNGEEAIEFVQTHTIELAILDIQLLEMDGITLGNKLHKVNPNILLIYITGYEGVSPEPVVSTTYGRGIDNGRYPTPRTVLFGLSVTF